jgi:hypothetical protein
LKLTLALFLFLSSTIAAFSQHPRKQLEALKTDSQIIIDGYLDETEWRNALPATDFFQYDPYNGAPATEQTEIRILYDDVAIYIGAMMFDSAPDSILTELGFRDTDDLNNDYIGFIFLPFNDGLNGVQFAVSASGVQYDSKIYNDNGDAGWDAVWASRVKILENGWSAELKIPYSALRFSENADQTWGFNVERSIRRKREIATWNFVDKNIEGQLRQVGVLTNLKDIKPPLRLSFTPYASGYIEKLAQDNDWRYTTNYGMDLKYGINESFTLDLTLIPDFGQVQSDDQIFNLSPFEVYYEERRPFFTEGTELFNKGSIFYSRRVGDVPEGFYDVENQLTEHEYISDNPGKTRLLNATKISGRTGKGLGVGVFNAFSARSLATVTDSVSGVSRQVETQPFTNYNMMVFDQNLKNNSYISLYNTNVYKGKDHYTANVTGTEFQFFNRKSSWSVDGRFNLSQKYNPGEDTDLGFAYNVSLAKTSGSFRMRVTQYVEDENYDPNDLGFLDVNNEITNAATFSYNFYNPFWKFLWWYNTVSVWHQTLFSPREFVEFGFYGNSRATFRNRLTVGLDFEVMPVDKNDFNEPRTAGMFFVEPKGWEVGGFFSPNYARPFIIDGNVNYERSGTYDQTEVSFELSPRWRVNDNLTFRLSGEFEKDINDMGYVDKVPQGLETAVIFGKRDLQTIENILNTTYIFNTRLALDFRLRHYWLTARYSDFYTLNDDGLLDPSDYNQNNDFNFSAFNIDMIVRWEFAPGSELALAWKNAVLTYNESDLTDRFFGDLRNTLNSPADNSFSIKVLYFLDYLYLKKNR